MKKHKKVVKGIISYILTLFMTVFFALYLDAKVGWFMCVALILAPVLSVFFALLCSFFIRITCEIEECILAKEDVYQVKIKVYNQSLFPTTPIEIIMKDGAGVKAENKSTLMTLLPFEKKSFYVSYKAKICGPSVIGIEKVKVTDYLGLFGVKLFKTNFETMTGKVSVIPGITDMSIRDDKILKVMQASNHAEDGDDTIEVSTNTFGGFPGCDNREYIPGDPIKRINWKQSAKRGKLLVRLDDVLASKSVNLVLDSALKTEMFSEEALSESLEYSNVPREDLKAKVLEDTVETALGIARSLVLSSYSVNFFFADELSYQKLVLEDEKDIENIRLILSGYEFDQYSQKERFPNEELLDKYTSYIFCTPNDYKEVFSVLQNEEDAGRVSIFSIIGDACNSERKRDKNIRIENDKSLMVDKKEKMTKTVTKMIIPYLLALTSSMTIFSVFKVSPLSLWTILEAAVCALTFLLCNYAKKHKIIGGAAIAITIVAALFYFASVAFSGFSYMRWFMSAADTIENTFSYLMTIVVIFTLLFSMVLFYYTQVYYRTSAILVVTLLPYVIYVKLIKEVAMGYVIVAIVLNVAAFLFNTRKQRDKSKRILGYHSGIISLLVYAFCFIVMAIVIPKGQETKYYHVFEEWFLGGNTTVPIPEEYGNQNDYSGNADNFSQLNNRQLYVINNADMDEPLYLRRQVFDYYDFEHDRWYYDKEFSDYKYDNITSEAVSLKLRNKWLLKGMHMTEEVLPGFLEKYGLENMGEEFEETVFSAYIMARNFESYYWVTPAKTLKVYALNERPAYVNRHGIYGRAKDPFSRYTAYTADYISQKKNKEQWISRGGSDMDIETSLNMLTEIKMALSDFVFSREMDTVKAFYEESLLAVEYKKACAENTEKIPKRVKDLAFEITKGCTYDWEKAEALENYFHSGEFTYDLEYDAPDDSVEYFLFESKTGTCSDFASAYVLMARAVGLTARYVEGFVPTKEVSATYEWQYVVRTKSSHAYPEVFIPNLGFVVYEPTVCGINEQNVPQNGGLISYITTIVIRVAAVLAVVTFLIALILLVSKIIAPAISEKRFLRKVEKSDNKEAVILVYKRIINKFTVRYIEEAEVCTPYEFAKEFEDKFGYDISPLTFLVEKVVYQRKVIKADDKKTALELYLYVKTVIKEHKE